MKKFYVLFSILFLSIQLFSQDVSVLFQAPANAEQGQEFEISMTVNKSDVTGFARLQLDMPAGFSVKATQTQGSTFSFKENKIRFLWMTLPADKQLKVACMVKGDNTVSGNASISGSFSYVLNNETQRYAIPVQTIAFGGNALATSNEDAKKETERLDKERQEKLANEKAEHDRLAMEQAEKDAKLESEKLAQQYNLTSSGNENGGSAVAPEVKSTNQETTPSTEGTSSEVKTTNNNLTPSTEVITPEVKTTNNDLTPSTETIKVTENKTPVDVKRPETNKTTPTSKIKTNNAKSNSSDSYATSTATSKSGIEYKIQIGAFKTSPKNGYYKKLENNISEFQIKTSRDSDGFIRYFIGSFDNFTSVDNFHKRVTQLGYTSFIVAHQDGKKITIQQAKEISKN